MTIAAGIANKYYGSKKGLVNYYTYVNTINWIMKTKCMYACMYVCMYVWSLLHLSKISHNFSPLEFSMNIHS